MRLLFFADAHLAERPPLSRAESYPEDIFAKLEEVRRLAERADVSIFGGDLYHWTRPADTSHRLVRRTIEFLRAWPTDLYMIAGNHDLPPEGLAGLARTPLGVVLEAMEIEERHEVRLLDKDILWEDGTYPKGDPQSVAVQLSPAHWTPTLDADPSGYSVQRMERADFVVKVAHGMLMPAGVGHPFPCVTFDQLDTEADVILVGHCHWQTGPYMPHTQRDVGGGPRPHLIVGPGSIARTQRSALELKREPQVSLLTLRKVVTPMQAGIEIEHEFIPLTSARPASVAFAWTDASARATGLFEGYVAALEAGMDVSGLSVEDVLAEMEGRAPPGVAARARVYLEEAGI